MPENRILKIDLSEDGNEPLRNPIELGKRIRAILPKEGKAFLFLDEIQLCESIDSPYFDDVRTTSGEKPKITFYSVLNGILSAHKNVDCYVTRSNSKMLTKDVLTDLRGRGWEIKVQPLSFEDYLSAKSDSNLPRVFAEYLHYGGMPLSLSFDVPSDKEHYLKSLFEETYFRDIIERHSLQNDSSIRELTEVMASSVGSITTVSKIADTFRTVEKKGIARETVSSYLGYLSDSFLLEEAERYDIRERKIIGSGRKYYFADTGLRNALLGFRQRDVGHLIENVIYNELIRRGYSVSVGVISVFDKSNPKSNPMSDLEVDFVAEKGDERDYIQSSYKIYDKKKLEQETKSLRSISDSFRKILVEEDDFPPYYDGFGIYHIGIFDFLRKGDSSEN